jgi:hypothetical protein
VVGFGEGCLDGFVGFIVGEYVGFLVDAIIG